jgi:hypothetical protein
MATGCFISIAVSGTLVNGPNLAGDRPDKTEVSDRERVVADPVTQDLGGTATDRSERGSQHEWGASTDYCACSVGNCGFDSADDYDQPDL